MRNVSTSLKMDPNKEYLKRKRVCHNIVIVFILFLIILLVIATVGSLYYTSKFRVTFSGLQPSNPDPSIHGDLSDTKKKKNQKRRSSSSPSSSSLSQIGTQISTQSQTDGKDGKDSLGIDGNITYCTINADCGQNGVCKCLDPPHCSVGKCIKRPQSFHLKTGIVKNGT